MDDSPLEIAPPRREFLYIFLITGVVFLLNGLAVLFFSPVPRSPDAVQPGALSTSFGVGGWMPIVAGLLCFAGAGWMLNRYRKVALIAELVHADLPRNGYDRDSRDRLLAALLERADQLRSALAPFPEALVSIDLRMGDSHRLDLELGSGGLSGRLSPVSHRLSKEIEGHVEFVLLEHEILLDLVSPSKSAEFLDTLTSEILRLPPDFELSGDIRVSKRESSTSS